jgi:3'-5' exonuclease
MHSRLLVFDIETVPDRELLPEPSTGTEEPFPKPLHHQVIAISFVSAQITRIGRIERYDVEECRSGGTLDSTGPELLRGFWALIEREKPRVVTWNGRTFDLPVLARERSSTGFRCAIGIRRGIGGIHIGNDMRSIGAATLWMYWADTVHPNI